MRAINLLFLLILSCASSKNSELEHEVIDIGNIDRRIRYFQEYQMRPCQKVKAQLTVSAKPITLVKGKSKREVQKFESTYFLAKKEAFLYGANAIVVKNIGELIDVPYIVTDLYRCRRGR